MYYFTADEHYGHANIIKYCNRPFENVNEMDEYLIDRFNKKVEKNAVTIHAGDFSLKKSFQEVREIIKRLNGNHIFLKGSHDYWLPRNKSIQIWEKKLNQNYVVVCHYAMRTWARSHYNSWHLFGHSHGKLDPVGKSWAIGVDNNDFEPLSFEEICRIMENRPDNPNLIKKLRKERSN